MTPITELMTTVEIMDVEFLLNLFLGLSVAMLIAVWVTGLRAKRGLHLSCVIAMVIFLLATIYFAWSVGKLLQFPPDRYAIHMPLARIAFYMLFAPVVTGSMHWFGKISRKAHLFAAILFTVMTLAAFATGAWMMMGAAPK